MSEKMKRIRNKELCLRKHELIVIVDLVGGICNITVVVQTKGGVEEIREDCCSVDSLFMGNHIYNQQRFQGTEMKAVIGL